MSTLLHSIDERAIGGDGTITLRTPGMWFWIKAGMGLAIGWGIMFVAAWLFWMTLFASLGAMLLFGQR